MRFRRLWLFRQLTSAERARRFHEEWLSAALRSGRSFPRIPVRKVSEGGFSGMLRRPGGREVAARWWEDALEKVRP